MNPHLAPFSTEQVAKAFDRLQLSGAERQTVTEMLKESATRSSPLPPAKGRSVSGGLTRAATPSRHTKAMREQLRVS